MPSNDVGLSVIVPDLSQKIRVYLAHSGVGSNHLAKDSDIEPSAMRKYMRGVKNPGKRVSNRIAQAMGITLAELQAGLPTFVAGLRRSTTKEER